MIKTMLKILAYIKTSGLPGLPRNANLEAALQSTSPMYIYSKLWKKYCEFQEEHQSRIDLLLIEKCELLVQDGADRNMPPIPTSWTGTAAAAGTAGAAGGDGAAGANDTDDDDDTPMFSAAA
jgi:hypothetical protein